MLNKIKGVHCRSPKGEVLSPFLQSFASYSLKHLGSVASIKVVRSSILSKVLNPGVFLIPSVKKSYSLQDSSDALIDRSREVSRINGTVARLTCVSVS